MNETQARAVANKIIAELAEQEWRMVVHRQISHPLEPNREIHIQLAVKGMHLHIYEPLPEDFFSQHSPTFTLSLSVDKPNAFIDIHRLVLDFLDSLLSDVETTFLLDDDDVVMLTTGLLKEVDDIESIGNFIIPCKFRIGKVKTMFSIRSKVSLATLLPTNTVTAIRATAEMLAGSEEKEATPRLAS